jgi:geranylgeranyl pyrophosphate synthase
MSTPTGDCWDRVAVRLSYLLNRDGLAPCEMAALIRTAAQAELDKLRADLAAANAACAEMRDALLVVNDWDDKPGKPSTADMLLAVFKALSTSAGRDYSQRMERLEQALREASVTYEAMEAHGTLDAHSEHAYALVTAALAKGGAR